jgi:hypothetical protein
MDIDKYFTNVGCLNGTGLGFQIMSHCQNIRISSVADSSLFSSSELDAVNDAIIKEMMDLHRHIKV